MDSEPWTENTRWIDVIVILLAAVVATAPLVVHGFSCGHDFDFHLVSWMDALHAWQHGVLYPHWTPSANYEAGEPRFVFYPPLTWMLGALLGAVFGWQGAPVLLTFILLAATGLAVRALARVMLPEDAATLAGCIAIFSGYALFCVYERSAYAELAGGCTIPLVLLFALRTPNQNAAIPFWRRISALPLALAIAACWLSNAPVGVMASYLLAAFALARAVLTRSWTPILRACTGVALGLGLAAFYLVPAAVEQRWVDIREATDDPGLQIENSFIFARHANPLLAAHDVELFKTSVIAAAMLSVAFLSLLVCWLRRRLPGQRALWLPLALIPLTVLLLQLPISLPLWNLLPKLRFLQFPWRWLVVLEAPLGIFLACAISVRALRMRQALIGLCAIAFVSMTVYAGTYLYQPCDDEDAISGMTDAYQTGLGFEGTDEYAPPGADNTLVASGLPAACLVSDATTELGIGDPNNPPPEWTPEQHSCDATFNFAPSTEEHKRIHADVPHAGYLILRLRSYPAWNVRINGHAAGTMPTREDGLMAVPVPAGTADITLDWTTTPDVLTGRWISLIALVITIALAFVQLKNRPAQ